MRFAGLVLVLSCPLVLAAESECPVKSTDALNMGLQGPVHRVKVKINRLPDFTRLHSEAALPPFDPWMVFDPSGAFIERSNSLAADGTPEVISRNRMGPDGLPETEEIRAGRSSVWRSEETFGPYGPIESRNYRDGVLQSFAKYEYDAAGNVTNQSAWDPAGKLLSRSINRFDDAGGMVEWEIHGPGDRFQLHVLDTNDENGALLERDILDADGRIILSMAFREECLISSWHAPECRGVSLGFRVSNGDRSAAYDVKDDCSLEVTVERHPARERPA